MRILPQGRSIVFASRSAKQALLTKQRENKVFSNLKIFDYKQLFGWVSDRFFFYMHKNHGLNYTMSLKILKYLDFIEIDKDYQSSKLSQMKKIKMGLMNDGIYQPFAFEMYESFPLFSVSKMPVPWMFKQTVEPLESFERANEPVRLIETNSDMDACHAVYEEVSRLLENHVSPDNIKILNANATDLFQLQKLFRDAGIPLCIHHQNPLTNYPSIQYLIKILDNDGFDVFLEALDSRKDELIIKPLIDLVNRYPNELLKANIALFKEMISSLKSPRELVEGAVTTLSLSEVDFDKDTYHLLMNYSDEGLVPYQKHHDYLEVFEAMELGYFSLEEINSHLQEDYLYILESLEQLTLVFSKFSEHENRLPDLELHRDIIRIAYHYTVKEKSHLKTLDVLDYAKAEYDYQTYFLERDDHDLLYATYHSSVNRYHHQFSGINQEDLDHLIASHNTLTGAKIESYHLCKFQYLMKYLLKLGRNEPSIHTFLGSLTHKVFEEALKENHEPINDIIAFHLDFPEDEKYKEKVFRNALTEEIKKLLPIFLDFHEQTSFNFVETEISFSIPMDGFQLTGTIDKAMILKTEEDKEYVVVVDYKISDKDFQISDFESGRYLQLPVYLYAFINQSHRKIIPAGLFYQPTGLGRYKKETNAILRHFKMKGIGLRSQSVMQKLDNDLTHIQGIKFRKDGSFAETNRLLDESGFKDLLEKVEKQILEAIEQIKSGDFSIDPLPSFGIKKDSVSCEYCQFSHICYNKNKGLGGVEE